MSGELSIAAVFEALRNPPSYVIGLVSAFFGGLLTHFFDPYIQWNIEKKRELRQHRRELIAQWRAMISDVNKELARLEQSGTSYDLDDVPSHP